MKTIFYSLFILLSTQAISQSLGGLDYVNGHQELKLGMSISEIQELDYIGSIENDEVYYYKPNDPSFFNVMGNTYDSARLLFKNKILHKIDIVKILSEGDYYKDAQDLAMSSAMGFKNFFNAPTEIKDLPMFETSIIWESKKVILEVSSNSTSGPYSESHVVFTIKELTN